MLAQYLNRSVIFLGGIIGNTEYSEALICEWLGYISRMGMKWENLEGRDNWMGYIGIRKCKVRSQAVLLKDRALGVGK